MAVEYGVLARDRFLKRLPKLRALGEFKELLEPGGTIVYRNLFRAEQARSAWELLATLRPWQDRLTAYVSGDEVPLKEVQDALWCAAYPPPEDGCRGSSKKKTRPIGCPGARLLLGPTSWDVDQADQRHALTFAAVDASGVLRFNRAAVAAFFGGSGLARLCPRSPARDPEALAAALHDVSVRALGWPLIAELQPEVIRRAAKAWEQEHGFVLLPGAAELEAHAVLDLTATGTEPEQVEVRLAASGEPIGEGVRLPIAVRRLLAEGLRLRAVRLDEAYVRRKGGHYEIEQRFVLQPRFHLLDTDRPDELPGHDLSTSPRVTPEYGRWVEETVERLP